MLGFLSVSTGSGAERATTANGFNPVLGFLSVSTRLFENTTVTLSWFQSRAGFSECLDPKRDSYRWGVVTVSIPCWVF